MALGLRATSQITSDGSAGLTSTPTLARPAGTQNGDWLLACFIFPGGVSFTGVPSGWNEELNVVVSNGSTTERYAIFSKVASGEPASWTWSVSAEIAFYNIIAAAITGVNATDPVDTSTSTTATPGATGSVIGRTSTTTVPNGGLVTVALTTPPSAGNDPTHTQDAGTEVLDNHGANAADMGICINLLDVPTPATQTVNVTANWTGGTGAGRVVMQFSVYPTIITAGRSLVLPYTKNALSGKSLALPYTQIGVVGRSLALPYIGRVFLPASVALTYKVLVLLGRTLALPYSLRVEIGRSLAMSYGVAFAVPIPGKSGIDTYADGASSPFGLAVNEASDLSIFATWVSIPWSPPEDLEEVHYARLPHVEAQEVFELSPIETKSVRRAKVGWHGTKFDRERGSFAVVASDGALADLVGERLRLTFSDLPRTKSIFVYVHDEGELADAADISLPRRTFLALALLHETTVDVNVEVAG